MGTASGHPPQIRRTGRMPHARSLRRRGPTLLPSRPKAYLAWPPGLPTRAPPCCLLMHNRHFYSIRQRTHPSAARTACQAYYPFLPRNPQTTVVQSPLHGIAATNPSIASCPLSCPLILHGRGIHSPSPSAQPVSDCIPPTAAPTGPTRRRAPAITVLKCPAADGSGPFPLALHYRPHSTQLPMPLPPPHTWV
jgi:hypothetical protein